jgi:hypothetical protein
MSRLKALSTAAALVMAASNAAAQGTITNFFQSVAQPISAEQITEASNAHNLVFACPGLAYATHDIRSGLPSTYLPENQSLDLANVLDADAQTTLLGSFPAATSNAGWNLFLSDVDFGEQGTLVKWGPIITAIPEPSSWLFVGLGGAVMAIYFLRRRVSN